MCYERNDFRLQLRAKFLKGEVERMIHMVRLFYLSVSERDGI